MFQQEILNVGLALTAFRGLAWRYDMEYKSRFLRDRRCERILEFFEMVGCDVSVRDQYIRRGWQSLQDRFDDVRHQVKATVNGFLPEDRHFLDVDVGHRGFEVRRRAFECARRRGQRTRHF